MEHVLYQLYLEFSLRPDRFNDQAIHQQFIIRTFFFLHLLLQEFLFQEDPAFSQLFQCKNIPWHIAPLLASALTFQEKIVENQNPWKACAISDEHTNISQMEKLEELIFKL